MRISDWSSDVCSSDLGIGQCGFTDIGPPDNSDEPAMERFRHFLSCVTATGRESCADLRALDLPLAPFAGEIALIASRASVRSEEHTSELQSLMRISYAVFCLNKKKDTKIIHRTN